MLAIDLLLFKKARLCRFTMCDVCASDEYVYVNHKKMNYFIITNHIYHM